MTVYIFCGPTISPVDARPLLDAIYVPPAALGDVYKCSLHRPTAIGIIDGYFERRPAVWHKEILWALEQGIHVFGSASMGALRAAELLPFGMVGVGRIFEDYRDGVLEDDDEVALIHGSAENLYRAVSEPMVNIRATLLRAEALGIVSSEFKSALLNLAKRLYYADRHYTRIFRLAIEAGYCEQEVSRLSLWLETNNVDQKRLDAEDMLRLIGGSRDTLLQKKTVAFKMERTVFWEQLAGRSGSFEFLEGGESRSVPEDRLLDFMRLDVNAYVTIMRKVIVRLLGVRECVRSGWNPDQKAVHEELNRFKVKLGFTDEQEFDDWLMINCSSRGEFTDMVSDSLKERRTVQEFAKAPFYYVKSILLLENEFYKQMKELGQRRAAIESSGFTHMSVKDVGMTDAQLIDWYWRREGVQEFMTFNAFMEEMGYRDYSHCILNVLEDFLVATRLTKEL